jgi:hypothetical protein
VGNHEQPEDRGGQKVKRDPNNPEELRQEILFFGGRGTDGPLDDACSKWTDAGRRVHPAGGLDRGEGGEKMSRNRWRGTA